MLWDWAESHFPSLSVFLRDTVAAYPLWSVVDAKGDPSRGRGNWGVNCDVIHGETRQLTSDFKHVKLGARVDKKRDVQRRWGNSCFKKNSYMAEYTFFLLTHILPNFPSNKGFNVQIYWYIFWGDNGDSDTAGQVLGTGVDNVALPLKYPLCEYEHCTDNGFWKGQRRDSGTTK